MGNGTEEIRLQSLIPAAIAAGLDVHASTYFHLSVSLTPLTP